MDTLTENDIKVGHTYRAKKPREVNFVTKEKDDRTVLYIGPYSKNVQYDGPAVKIGAKYPTVPMDKFLKWAGHELTEEPENAARTD